MEPRFKPELETSKRVLIYPPRSGTQPRDDAPPPAPGENLPTFPEIITELVEDVLNISTLMPRIKPAEKEVPVISVYFRFFDCSVKFL